MPQMNPRLAQRAPIDLATLDERRLMTCIDHSLLRPELTKADVEAGFEIALEWQTATVCVRPADVQLAYTRLRRTPVAISAVVGFPHGSSTPQIKKREALVAIEQGAVELDVVANIGVLRSGELGAARDELADLVYAVAPVPVKVIIETAYLTPEQVEAGCRIVLESRAAFVKNATGFSPRGATPEEIAFMRRIVGDNVGVKAAGGIRSLDAALAILLAGACRFGATATAAIGTEWRERGPQALEALGIVPATPETQA